MFIELENGVEGLVHISSLMDDYYEFYDWMYSREGVDRKGIITNIVGTDNIFCYSEFDKQTIFTNLSLSDYPRNLNVITPNELEEKYKSKHEVEDESDWFSFDLSNLTELLRDISFEE